MIRSIFVNTIGVVVALSACSKARDPRPAPESASSDSSRHATAPPAPNPRDINALFRVEAEHRPQGTPRVEDVMAAFRGAGVGLRAERQHLARPYGARYCVGAEFGPDVALSVCEYIDRKAAEAGVASSRKIPLKDREIRLQRATSLTVRLLKKTPESQALEGQLFEAFAKL